MTAVDRSRDEESATDDARMERAVDTRPLIVTARMDPQAQAMFDALRRAHFPPERNWLSAHITLFHALPGLERALIEEVLRDATKASGPWAAEVKGVRFLGNGVAFNVESADLTDMRCSIAMRLAPWLTRQDQQGFRPHVTVQNKVKADVARALLQTLSAEFTPWSFAITGLDLWHYDGGPWGKASFFPLQPRRASSDHGVA